MSIHYQLENLWEDCRIGRKGQSRRGGIRQRIDELLKSRWPDASLSLEVFGSSTQGLATHDSDLDLCIVDPARPFGPSGPRFPSALEQSRGASDEEWYDVRMLARLIEAHATQQGDGTPAWYIAFEDVRAVANAKVPRVSFRAVWEGGEIKVDLVVNDRMGMRKTELIGDYVGLQPYILPLLYVGIRAWLRYHELSGLSPEGTPRSLSNYAVKIIIIEFLQGCGLLPDLQHPLLLEHAKIDRSHFCSPPSHGYNDGETVRDVSYFSPSHLPSYVKPVTVGPPWHRYRFYRHDDEPQGTYPTSLSWRWDRLERECLDLEQYGGRLGPPRRVALHCISSGVNGAAEDEEWHDVSKLFGGFFPWFHERIRLDTKANPRSRAFCVNRSALPPASEFPERWRNVPLLVLDPFDLDANVAVNVQSWKVTKRLAEATLKAIQRTDEDHWTLSELNHGI